MFSPAIPHPEKRATALQTLTIINEVCHTLGTNTSTMALSTGMRAIANHFGWTTAEILEVSPGK